ncbi:Oidioi.mRNA.OKI2018_I69.XSR.g16014.t1.cds [Oikopleura dioica]|uniref:Oidioi.mRNA.OKI2018_I69.XSR.g16014.t1.cds n=1 Tax=Oikopleura dioica TaxID=34765 RepID=A0ABN7SEP4_OIKDI|nr:Oidioi.mRNA.OKI2018_I69.XSR.g16014.t1.cds [Oikopleura dioica]
MNDCRNPIIGLLGNKAVGNSAFIPPEKSGMLITGPNMAGKSTFLSTIGVCQIIAQLGCAAPVSEGSKTKVFKQIRCNIDQDRMQISGTCSSNSFSEDLSNIMAAAEQNSLLLIDELGKDVSNIGVGASTAYALLERLAKSECNFFFVTHFPELKKILPSEKIMKRRQDYGVELAESLIWPTGCVERLRAIQDKMLTEKRDAIYAAERKAEDQEIAKTALMFCSFYKNKYSQS